MQIIENSIAVGVFITWNLQLLTKIVKCVKTIFNRRFRIDIHGTSNWPCQVGVLIGPLSLNSNRVVGGSLVYFYLVGAMDTPPKNGEIKRFLALNRPNRGDGLRN